MIWPQEIASPGSVVSYYFSMRHLIRLRIQLGVSTRNRSESPIPVIAEAMHVGYVTLNEMNTLNYRGKLLHQVAYWDIGLCAVG